MGIWDNLSTHLGNSTSGQLPNITGYMAPHGGARGANGVFSGAFYNTGVQEESGASISGSGGRWGFDASRVSSAYSRNDNIVIPSCLWLFYVIKF